MLIFSCCGTSCVLWHELRALARVACFGASCVLFRELRADPHALRAVVSAHACH